MNNKGFTLIELIIVVAIISVLSLLFIPNVTNLIDKHNTNTYNSIIQSIKSAAKNFVSDNRYDLDMLNNNCGGTTMIQLDKLVNKGYLSELPTNPCKNNTSLNFKNDEKVTVTFDCTIKDYKYSFREETHNEEIDVNKCKKRG